MKNKNQALKGKAYLICMAATLVFISVIYLMTQISTASFSINTNLSSLQAIEDLRRTQAALNEVFARISNGLRLLNSGDDAEGLGILSEMNASLDEINGVLRDTGNNISLLEKTGASFEEIGTMLSSLRSQATETGQSNISQSTKASAIEAIDNISRLASEKFRVKIAQPSENRKRTKPSRKRLTVINSEEAVKDRLNQSLNNLVSDTRNFFAITATGKRINLKSFVKSVDETAALLQKTSEEIIDLSKKIISNSEETLEKANASIRNFENWLSEDVNLQYEETDEDNSNEDEE